MAPFHKTESILQRLRKTASDTHLHGPRRNPMVVEQLEPRILYSADAGAALLGDIAAPQIEHRVIENSGEFAPSAAQAEQRQALEIVFVDPATPDYQTLIDDIRANGQDGRYLEVVLLDGQRDGIAQISEYLAACTDVSAIHIISHGSDGAVQLGLGILDAESLSTNDAQISNWGNALSQDADLLIYGCDVAATESGRALIDNLARLTGADVAASEDSTGNARLGGNWDFEYRIGTIEAHLALSQEAQVEWYGLLDTVLTSHAPPFTSLGDQAYEVKAGQSWGQTFTYDSPSPTYTVDKVGLVLYRAVDAAAGQTITVSLRSTWNGAVIASGSVVSDSLGTSEAWVDVVLSGAATLSDNLTYVIQVESNGTEKIYVGVHDSGTYAGGTLLNSGGVAEPPKDMAFRIIDASSSAPMLAGANNLTAINEDPAANPGTLVSALIAGQVTDPDAGALTGIAITAVDNTNGTWQYSTNGGSTWNDFGTPGAASARLLASDGNSYVRFVPNADWSGTVTNGLTFRAWDQTSGVNGGTADTTTQVSTVRDNFGAISYSNNDGSSAWAADWVDTDGNPFGGNIRIGGGQLELLSNIGSGSIYREANLSGATGATLSFDFNNELFLSLGGNITLQVSGDGGGSYTTLTTFSPGSNTGTGSYSEDISAYVANNTRIRFSITGISVPTQTLFVDDLQISYSTPLNGGSTAFSSATASSSITVTSVNDAPTLNAPAAIAVTEDVASALTGITFADVDAGGASVVGTFTVPQGTLAATSGGGVIVSGSATALTLTGSIANINAFIAASNLTYTTAPDDTSAVTLGVSISDGGNTGSGGMLSAAANVTLNVNAVNDAPMGLPNISGTVAENQILTADTSGISDADGLGAFSYQWLRDGVAIGGATAFTYVLGDADVGTLISVRVSYTDAQGTAEGPLTSPQTAAVTNVNDAPVGVPTISGTVTEGQVLSADTSSFSDGDGLDAFSYQWLRDGVAIGGATASTYTLDGADVGTQISVAVSYSDGNGTNEGPLTSVQTAFVANVPPTAPSGPVPMIPGDAGTPPVVTAPTPSATGDSGTAPAEASDGNIDSEAPGTATQNEASAEETATGSPADSTPAGRSNQNALLGSGSEQATRAGRGSNVAYGSGDLRLLWATPELLEATLADIALTPGDAQHAIQTALAALQSTDLLNELDRLRDDLLEESRIEANTIALTTAATLGLSVGYVFWLLRGGVLLSTLLSSLPAWRFVDPLPILGRLEDDDDEAGEPDESLESMVARKNRTVIDKKFGVAPA